MTGTVKIPVHLGDASNEAGAGMFGWCPQWLDGALDPWTA